MSKYVSIWRKQGLQGGGRRLRVCGAILSAGHAPGRADVVFFLFVGNENLPNGSIMTMMCDRRSTRTSFLGSRGAIIID